MGKTNNAGINYAGKSGANLDSETNIHYGVINQHLVGEAWYDTAEPYYGDYSECPHCGAASDCAELSMGGQLKCRCGEVYYGEIPDCAEPLSFFIDDVNLKAESDVEDGDIFVMKSEFFTYAQFCSPCAPGACYLANWLEEPNENNKAYCFGHEWFMEGKAPYPVYSVKTGKLVEPPAK